MRLPIVFFLWRGFRHRLPRLAAASRLLLDPRGDDGGMGNGRLGGRHQTGREAARHQARHGSVHSEGRRREAPCDGIHRLSLQPSKRVRDLSHASGRDGVAGRVGGPRHTSCTDSSTGETHTGTSYIHQCVRSDASSETFRILRDYTAYLRQGRSQERPAEGRRPLGCRTAEDGGGSCEGAAPPAHC